MKRTTIIEVISYAFIMLFLYTALSKLLAYDTYLYDLRRSPMLAPYAVLLAVIVPIAELIISVLLFFDNTRKVGLYASLGLMSVFTVYVGYLLSTRSGLPCTCGGMIRDLTWKQHFYFNVFFTLLATIGIWLHNRKEPKGMNYQYKYN